MPSCLPYLRWQTWCWWKLLIQPDWQHLLNRCPGGCQGAEVILQAKTAPSPRLCACVHTLFTCLLFSLFFCCLPRDPAALARGTCQACVYRTRSRYRGACLLQAVLELVVQCVRAAVTTLCSGPGTGITPCSLAGLGGGRISSGGRRGEQDNAVQRVASGNECLFGEGLQLGSSPLRHFSDRSFPGLALHLVSHWPMLLGLPRSTRTLSTWCCKKPETEPEGERE